MTTELNNTVQKAIEVYQKQKHNITHITNEIKKIVSKHWQNFTDEAIDFCPNISFMECREEIDGCIFNITLWRIETEYVEGILFNTPIQNDEGVFSINIKVGKKSLQKEFSKEFPKKFDEIINMFLRQEFNKLFKDEERKRIYESIFYDTNDIMEVDSLLDDITNSETYKIIAVNKQWDEEQIAYIIYMLMLFYEQNNLMRAHCVMEDYFGLEFYNDLEIN